MVLESGIVAKLVQAMIFILPSYFANAAPVIFETGKSKTPMDMGAKFYDSKRVLGKGKTWTGFFVGIVAGTFVGYVTWITGLMNAYPSLELHLTAAFLLATGTMVGDAVGSFIKRRLSIKSGKSFVIMDQLSFIVVALIFVSPLLLAFIDWAIIAMLLVITPFVHYFANVLAYKLKMKNVPW